MSLMEKKKLEEGLEHVRLAEKHLKTSPIKLKFSPDWDPAGDEFSKAATCFKVGKNYEESKKCLLRAVDCYKEIHSIFQAGRMLEQAVMVCRDQGQLEEVKELAGRGALMYRQVNKPESASQLLDKAAKILEKTHPEDALSMYEKAAETVATEDRPGVAADYISKAARLYVRTKQYDSAANALRGEVQYRQNAGSGAVGRPVVALVLVQLARGDMVAAEKVQKEWGGYADPDQARALEMILRGYDEQDHDVTHKGLSSAAVMELDLDFAKLARDLPRPKKGSDTGEGDGDELGGLC